MTGRGSDSSGMCYVVTGTHIHLQHTALFLFATYGFVYLCNIWLLFTRVVLFFRHVMRACRHERAVFSAAGAPQLVPVAAAAACAASP